MRFTEYLVHSTGLLFSPGQAIKDLALRYRPHSLGYGILVFLLGNSALVLSGVMMNSVNHSVSAGQLAGMVLSSLLIYLFINLLHLAIIYFVLGLMQINVDLAVMTGQFLGMDVLLMLAIPLSLIFHHLSILPGGLYQFLMLLLMLYIIILKTRLLILVSGVRSQTALGLILLPGVSFSFTGLLIIISLFERLA